MKAISYSTACIGIFSLVLIGCSSSIQDQQEEPLNDVPSQRVEEAADDTILYPQITLDSRPVGEPVQFHYDIPNDVGFIELIDSKVYYEEGSDTTYVLLIVKQMNGTNPHTMSDHFTLDINEVSVVRRTDPGADLSIDSLAGLSVRVEVINNPKRQGTPNKSTALKSADDIKDNG